MATSGSIDSAGYQGRYIYFEWSTQSTSAENNTRTIKYKFIAEGGSSSIYYHHNNVFQLNGETVYTGSQSEAIETGTVLVEGTYTINQNNTTKLRVDMDGGIYSYENNINTANEWDLDTIPRYAKVNISLNSKTLNSINLNYSTDSTIDGIWVSKNGGAWESGYAVSSPININGLSPNTKYTLKIKVKRLDSQLYSESNTIEVTTYDIAKISSLNNFEHGNSTSIVITNPSGSSLNLVMKIGNTQILSKSISAGTNTINFSDTELDNIYKLYGSSNSLTATFVLTTASKYTNSKTCTITLKRKSKDNKK